MRQSSQDRTGPIIVSVQLAAEAKAQLDFACDQRGMTIKTLLGRLIQWFVSIDKTEQSIVLNQVEDVDMKSLAELVLDRRSRGITHDPAASIKAASSRKPRRRGPAKDAE